MNKSQAFFQLGITYKLKKLYPVKCQYLSNTFLMLLVSVIESSRDDGTVTTISITGIDITSISVCWPPGLMVK